LAASSAWSLLVSGTEVGQWFVTWLTSRMEMLLYGIRID